MKKVVLLGRPNVGKSSLFNVLAKKKEALVSVVENMTRDVKWVEITSLGHRYLLADMGGLTDGKGDFLDLVNQKIEREVKNADLTLVLFDSRNVTSDDRSVLKFAQKNARKILPVFNKADTEEVELLNTEVHSLGLKDYLFISSKNLRHIGTLRHKIDELLGEALDEGNLGEKNLEAENLDGKEAPSQEAPPLRIAILGRPNSGKSSLLNRFLGEDRAIVSDVSGTTRDSIDGTFLYKGVSIQVIDTAGIRKKGRSKEEPEELSLKKALQVTAEVNVVLVLIDAKENIAMQDKKIAQVVSHRNKAVIYVINKWDLSPYSWKEYHSYLINEFNLLKTAHLLPISCKTGKGLEELKKALLEVNRQLNCKMSRRELKRILEEAVMRNPIPKAGDGHKRRQPKILDAKQVSVNPLGVDLYVKYGEDIKKNYLLYVENLIKKYYKLEGVPLKVRCVEKGTPSPSSEETTESSTRHKKPIGKTTGRDLLRTPKIVSNGK